MARGRIHSREFKLQVVHEVTSGAKRPAQVCREYGLANSVLGRWRRSRWIRHALVIDDQMRPLFAYMRALTLPTSVFAAPEDWGTPDLGTRIARAATELAVMVQAGVEHQIADRAWSGYQHQFAGNATRTQRTAADLDFDSPLMRLAAGGRPAPPELVRAGSATGAAHRANGRVPDDRPA